MAVVAKLHGFRGDFHCRQYIEHTYLPHANGLVIMLGMC